MRIPSVFLSIFQKHIQTQSPLRKSLRTFSTVRERTYEEIKISVPWGHIAGKWYGPKDKRPIVGLHGWQDNAGTFDTLAPLLPPHVGFLSLDLPGHGLSSWLPNGCSYHSMDHINIFMILMRELKWNKISMLSHSMSAGDGLLFTSLFPDKCDLFIAVDLVQPLVGKKNITTNMMIEQFEEFNKQIEISLSNTKPPCYTRDKLIERMRRKNGNAIDDDLYEIILYRNLKRSDENPNEFYFSRDGRLKSMVFPIYPYDVLLEMANRIKCPHMFIRANRSKHYYSKRELEEVINAFKINPDFQFHMVDGTHYVHLNEPQKIAEIVNPFILKYRPE